MKLSSDELQALVGRRVIHVVTDEHDYDHIDYGVIFHAWYEASIDDIDCSVAFFGYELPQGKALEKPYVLRYALSQFKTLPG